MLSTGGAGDFKLKIEKCTNLGQDAFPFFDFFNFKFAIFILQSPVPPVPCGMIWAGGVPPARREWGLRLNRSAFALRMGRRTASNGV